MAKDMRRKPMTTKPEGAENAHTPEPMDIYRYVDDRRILILWIDQEILHYWTIGGHEVGEKDVSVFTEMCAFDCNALACVNACKGMGDPEARARELLAKEAQLADTVPAGELRALAREHTGTHMTAYQLIYRIREILDKHGVDKPPGAEPERRVLVNLPPRHAGKSTIQEQWERCPLEPQKSPAHALPESCGKCRFFRIRTGDFQSVRCNHPDFETTAGPCPLESESCENCTALEAENAELKALLTRANNGLEESARFAIDVDDKFIRFWTT
jgi:hypothetical protein